ncbi:lipopolysaccharide biosynthesis protein [Deinococcus ruber]|uniref:lipopolysaccharide biosynthesis protein n=1 Tax=Deinococcus ruber TaxID=1848197 RepID=UPI00166A3A50|nr:hypothetical protein [Deinococcus ruber]
MASIFARGFAIVTTLVLTPLIIHTLGVTHYGFWFLATLISTVIAFPDFGISNGVINKIADLNRTTGSILKGITSILEVSYLLRVLAIFWFLLGSLMIFLYVRTLNHATQQDELLQTLLLSLGIFCLGIPPTLWSRVQLALERGHESVIWEGVGKAAALFLSLIVLFIHPEIRWLTVATLLPPVVAAYCNGIFFTRRDMKNAYLSHKRKSLKETVVANLDILRTGGYFTVIQVAYILGFALDPFLIGRFGGVDQVSYVSVIRRPFDAFPLVITLFSTSLWPVFGRLQANSQFVQSRRLIISLCMWSAALIVILGGIVIVFQKPIYDLLGQSRFSVQSADLFWILLRTFAVTITIVQNNYMSAVNLVKRQALTQLTSGLISIVVVIPALYFGNIHVYLLVSSLIYFFFTLIPSLLISFGDINSKIKSSLESVVWYSDK